MWVIGYSTLMLAALMTFAQRVTSSCTSLPKSCGVLPTTSKPRLTMRARISSCAKTLTIDYQRQSANGRYREDWNLLASGLNRP